MIRTIAVLAACVLVSGCETTPIDEEVKPDTKRCTQGPVSQVTIKYGDSKIDVTHKVKVHKSNFLKLTLKPENSPHDPDDSLEKPVDYETLNIYLFGTTPDAKWLDGVYNAGGKNQRSFDICVDAPVGHYKYMVVIPGVGTIDPRVEIEN